MRSRTRRRKSREKRRGSVAIETLIVIGLVFIPVFVTMEYLHEEALSRGAVRQEARNAAMSLAATPGCEGGTSRSCASVPLGVGLSGPRGATRSRLLASQRPLDLHYAACARSADVENPRSGTRAVGGAHAFTCQEPEIDAVELDIETLLCGRNGFATGSDLCGQ